MTSLRGRQLIGTIAAVVAIAIGGAQTVGDDRGGVPTSGSSAAASTDDRDPSAQAPGRFVRRLERLAGRSAGFGFSDTALIDRQYVVVVGFVGPVPERVSRLVADAPEGVRASIAGSLYTARQLDRAVRQALDSRLAGVVSRLPRGRGIEVLTTSERLLASRNPRRLLGIDVGVLVGQGSASPVGAVAGSELVRTR